jgi:hypothetical protein
MVSLAQNSVFLKNCFITEDEYEEDYQFHMHSFCHRTRTRRRPRYRQQIEHSTAIILSILVYFIFNIR